MAHMSMWMNRVVMVWLLMMSSAAAQSGTDPFPSAIPAADGVVTVGFVEFASLPDVDGGGRRA